MRENIEAALEFIVEIDKLKGVLRKTKPVGLDRYENSGEHSWHVCISALMLHQYANESVDIGQVIKMLLIHDLGEIDAGDTIVYQEDKEEAKSKELEGVERLFELLPPEIGTEYLALWKEFEYGDSAEAKFARAIDRVPPILQNLQGDLHSWKENEIPMEKILAVNSRIKHGSEELWNVIESKLKAVDASGALDPAIDGK